MEIEKTKKAVFAAALALAMLAVHGGIVAYPEYDARIERDHAYAVRVSQENESRKLTVYNYCEKSALATRTHGGDVNRRFCEFAFSGGPVRVDVAFCEDVKSKDAFIHGRGMMLDPFSDIFRFDQKKNTKRGFRRRETGGNRRVPRRGQRTVRPLISR